MATFYSDAFCVDEHNGKILVADSALKMYDPATGQYDTLVADSGIIPSGQPLVASYKQRIVLSGDDHMVYFSAAGNDLNWDFGASSGVVTRAVALHVGAPGEIGAGVSALINYRDAALLVAGLDSLWVIEGDPVAGGSLSNVSRSIGILGHKAWCDIGGAVMFLSRDGIYIWSPGNAPQRFSTVVLPDDLRGVDPSANEITMCYDQYRGGVYLFITPGTGSGTHYWIDLGVKAFWPLEFPVGMQPMSASFVDAGGYSNVLLGCKDGYLRAFSDDESTDDGSSISSDVMIGPLHISGANNVDGMVQEMVIDLAAGSGTVTWRIVTGDSAEDAIDRAAAALDGDGETGVDDSGTVTAKSNSPVYPRSRGPWAVIWLSSTAQWAYESISIVARSLGRHRY